MTVRVSWAAALALALAPMMTSCATGVSQDVGDLRRTTIGTYLARNAGTGTFQTSTFDKAIAEKAHSEILQRLLELARAGRDGPPNRLVNEAVAAQSGYVCPDYDLPPGPQWGCTRADIPRHRWKATSEVRAAAERLGFACRSFTARAVDCTYKATFSQRYVRFAISPSIDGHPSGPNGMFEVTADMHFGPGGSPSLSVTEAKL